VAVIPSGARNDSGRLDSTQLELPPDSAEEVGNVYDQRGISFLWSPLEAAGLDERSGSLGRPTLDDPCIDIDDPVLRHADIEVVVALRDAH
jgi:hypothetical protein